MKPIAIIGVGNYLMGDEGAGIHATRLLRSKIARDDCDIIDAGVPSMALLHMIEGRELVIIVDCVDFGGKPGEIKSFKPDDVLRSESREISLHAGDLLTTLAIGKSIGLKQPSIWIMGIEPSKICPSTDLSNEVADALLNIPGQIENLINCCTETRHIKQ